MGAPGTTPGPWKPTERHGYHEIIGPRDASNWYGKKGVWAVAYCDTDRDDDENIANAHQIAASGVLYDAVESAFDFLGGVDGASEIRAELLAAIMLAKGSGQ